MPRAAGLEPKLQPFEKKDLQGRTGRSSRRHSLAGSRGTFQKSVWPVNRAPVRERMYLAVIGPEVPCADMGCRWPLRNARGTFPAHYC